jgi:hypothetical protein
MRVVHPLNPLRSVAHQSFIIWLNEHRYIAVEFITSTVRSFPSWFG